MIHHTTLAELKKRNCSFLDKLVSALGPDWGENTPIPLTKIIETNGIKDAIWALRANLHPDAEKESRLFACDMAERVLPLFEKQFPLDERPRKAIEISRLFAEGKANKEELGKARDAAYHAADAAYYHAANAAYYRAADAANHAAHDAADAAAYHASYAAANNAAANNAAAEREEQKKLFLKRFGENSGSNPDQNPEPRMKIDFFINVKDNIVFVTPYGGSHIKDAVLSAVDLMQTLIKLGFKALHCNEEFSIILRFNNKTVQIFQDSDPKEVYEDLYKKVMDGPFTGDPGL